MTDVITPKQIQRRATRLLNGNGMSRPNQGFNGAPSRAKEAKMVFKPRNMSYPTPPPHPSTSSSGARRDPPDSIRQSSTGNLMQKLRKQFSRGR